MLALSIIKCYVHSANGVKTNSNGKLCKANVVYIRELIKNKIFNQKEIARIFDISSAQISELINGKTYIYY